NDFPWSRKRPDLKGFKAPREFWKVVLRKEQGKLLATALLIDQSPLIDSLPELLDLSGEEAKGFAFEKVKKYQVSVAHLESKTGLDFGQSVRAADTFSGGGNERISLHSVEKVSDVALDLPYGRRDRRKVARPLRVHRVARNGHAKVS
ncbi:MAG TPA: DNA/RNA non-specific endonuclease, partial [Gemmatimonadales bacterium]|nr:DNA/RNA non-specific endonuclease [Gemmatimonadales bacterium]